MKDITLLENVIHTNISKGKMYLWRYIWLESKGALSLVEEVFLSWKGCFMFSSVTTERFGVNQKEEIEGALVACDRRLTKTSVSLHHL